MYDALESQVADPGEILDGRHLSSMYDAVESQVADPGEIVDGRHLLSLKTFLLGMYWCIQRIRGFTTMRYINQLFTYFTYLWCCRIPSRWSWGNRRQPTSVINVYDAVESQVADPGEILDGRRLLFLQGASLHRGTLHSARYSVSPQLSTMWLLRGGAARQQLRLPDPPQWTE